MKLTKTFRAAAALGVLALRIGVTPRTLLEMSASEFGRRCRLAQLRRVS